MANTKLSPNMIVTIERILARGNTAEVKIEKSQPVIIEIKRKKVEPPKE